MQKRKMFSLACLIVLTLYFPGFLDADGPGVDPVALEIQLRFLPLVESYEVDSEGHVTNLRGILTGPSDEDPEIIVRRFLAVNDVIFPRAQGTTFNLKQITRPSVTSGAAFLKFGQEIDDFEVQSEGLGFKLDYIGQLTEGSGIVFHAGDVQTPTPGGFVAAPEEKALEMAEMVVLKVVGGTILARTAKTKILKDGGAWAWRVDHIVLQKSQLFYVTVNLHVDSLDLISYQVNEVTADFSIYFGAKAQNADIGKAVTEVNCDASDSPPGDFSTQAGFGLWEGSGDPCPLVNWEFKAPSAVLSTSVCRIACPPVGTSPCNYGSIERAQPWVLPSDTDPNLPDYTRVRIQFGATESMPMAFRWGPTENEVMTFDVEDCNDVDGCQVFLNLANSETWLNGLPKNLMLEFGMPSKSGQIELLDILPGPHLKFASQPSLRYTDPNDNQFGWFPSVEMKIAQWFINAGCDFGLQGPGGGRSIGDGGGGGSIFPVHPQREVTYSLTPQDCENDDCSGGACTAAGAPVDVFSGDVPLFGGLGNDGAVFKELKSFFLPSPGCWELQGRFADGHAPASQTRIIEVEERPFPELKIAAQKPVECYSEIAGHYTRYEFINQRDLVASQGGFEVDFSYFFTGVGGAVDLPVAAYLRPHNPAGGLQQCQGPWPDDPVNPVSPWKMLFVDNEFSLSKTCDPGTVLCDPNGARIGLDPVDFEGNPLPFVAEGESGIFDLLIDVGQAPGEVFLDDNRLCIPAWIAISDGPLADGIGSSLILEWDFGGGVQNPEYYNIPKRNVLGAHILAGTHKDSDAGTYRYSVTSDSEPPRLVFSKEFPGGDSSDALVTGAMMRVRRPLSGETPDSQPFIAGGVDKDPTDFGILTPPGQPATNWIPPDNQWHTIMYRGGSAAPFGDFSVPILIQLSQPEPGMTVLTFEIEPDVLQGDGDYPDTYIDFVRTFVDPGATQGAEDPLPLQIMENVDDGSGGGRDFIWQGMPSVVRASSNHTLGLRVANPNPEPSTRNLYATIEIDNVTDQGRDGILLTYGPTVVSFGASSSEVLTFPEHTFGQGRFSVIGNLFDGDNPTVQFGGPISMVVDAVLIDIELAGISFFSTSNGDWEDLPSQPYAGLCYELGLKIQNEGHTNTSGVFHGSLEIWRPGSDTDADSDETFSSYQIPMTIEAQADRVLPVAPDQGSWWCPAAAGTYTFGRVVNFSELGGDPFEPIPGAGDTTYQVICRPPTVTLP